MSSNWNFGSINRRQLTLSWFAPLAFCTWDGRGGFPLVPLLLLNPLRWWRVAMYRDSWRLECRRWTEGTHRCYCPDGSMIDGCLFVCGFGVRWWYSHYTGEIPCLCDKAMEEMFGDEAAAATIEETA